MNPKEYWDASSPGRQWLIVVLGVAVLSAVLIGAYWLWRPNYQVLFRDLRPQDAATIVGELERQKFSYELAAGGSTILVPETDVHAARMKVMSKDLPLKGTVGFELFNNADLGLTEFAQKVNYQRALQGELTRTIGSLADIDTARVHLSFAEAGLFRRAGAQPRASVAITTRSGAELSPEVVRGIQRLVAAAVPELDPHEVTLVDGRGASLSGGGAGTVVSDAKLELKIELERYYVRKVLEQIEPVIGKGNASVSVDAALNFDQIKITNETSGAGSARRPRADAPAAETGAERAADDAARPAPRTASDQSYKRLEQIVGTPGGLRRLNVGVLLHGAVEPAVRDQLRQLVAASVGLSPERGDAVIVFAQDRAKRAEVAEVPLGAGRAPDAAAVVETASPAVAGTGAREAAFPLAWIVAAVAILLGVLALVLVGRRLARPAVAAAPVLTEAQRQAMLQRVRALLDGEQARVAR